jgi:hypothetical protein
MTTYPLDLMTLRISSNKPKDLEDAEKIIAYINRMMATDYKDQNPAMFTFGKIAIGVGLKEKQVQNYLHRLSGASNNSIEIHRDN